MLVAILVTIGLLAVSPGLPPTEHQPVRSLSETARNGTARVLRTDIDALLAVQSPGDPRGLYIGGDTKCWRCTSGVAVAAATLATMHPTDTASRQVAIKTFDRLIGSYRQPNGSF